METGKTEQTNDVDSALFDAQVREARRLYEKAWEVVPICIKVFSVSMLIFGFLMFFVVMFRNFKEGMLHLSGAVILIFLCFQRLNKYKTDKRGRNSVFIFLFLMPWYIHILNNPAPWNIHTEFRIQGLPMDMPIELRFSLFLIICATSVAFFVIRDDRKALIVHLSGFLLLYFFVLDWIKLIYLVAFGLIFNFRGRNYSLLIKNKIINISDFNAKFIEISMSPSDIMLKGGFWNARSSGWLEICLVSFCFASITMLSGSGLWVQTILLPMIIILLSEIRLVNLCYYENILEKITQQSKF